MVGGPSFDQDFPSGSALFRLPARAEELRPIFSLQERGEDDGDEQKQAGAHGNVNGLESAILPCSDQGN
jgi:hypothetical protein